MLNQLHTTGRAQKTLEGFPLDLQLDQEILYLSTTVFYGGDFLPKSVRQCVLSASDGTTRTSLIIDEPNHRILLLSVGPLSRLASQLTEFVSLAHDWHATLDQYGQQDLVYAPVS